MRLFSLALLSACVDYDLNGEEKEPRDTRDTADPSVVDPDGDGSCELQDFAAEPTEANDTCDYTIGGFEPVIEWAVSGTWSTALPVVGDLDGDGLPEIVVVWSGIFSGGTMAAYHGDGSGMLWESSENIGYGSAPAIADLDDDGVPEVIATLDNGWGGGYSVGAFDDQGDLIWESEAYTDGEFNWATGIAVSDMNHDGSPEIVAGRIILNSDGTERAEGRDTSIGGSTGFGTLMEGAHPAIADLDLDGQEEVITGDAIYDIDGSVIARNSSGDGAVAVANLDSDPEGEYVASFVNTIRAHDTDGTLLWGPLTNRSANIFSVPTIGDIDGDGEVEIIVAGGNEIWALNADGSELWAMPCTDTSGATGASIFDFDWDGVPEVVYIDEVAMYAFNGADGAIKFRSTDHASVTMYDYPVIADLDADGHTEIIVANQGDDGLTIYQDATNSWAPARDVWNQHAYSITNINDDLSVPVTQTPNFTVYNNYHSALAVAPGSDLGNEVEAEILDICDLDCDAGTLRVWGRGRNTGNTDLEPGLKVALYGTPGNVLLGVQETTTVTPALTTTEGLEYVVSAELLDGVDGLELRVDDDGTGVGAIGECIETNNTYSEDGAWCR